MIAWVFLQKTAEVRATAGWPADGSYGFLLFNDLRFPPTLTAGASRQAQSGLLGAAETEPTRQDQWMPQIGRGSRILDQLL